MQLLGAVEDENESNGFQKRRRGSSDPLAQLINEEEPASKRQHTAEESALLCLS